MKYWIESRLRKENIDPLKDDGFVRYHTFDELSAAVAEEIYNRITAIDPEQVARQLGEKTEKDAAKWHLLMSRYPWGGDYEINGADLVDYINNLREGE